MKPITYKLFLLFFSFSCIALLGHEGNEHEIGNDINRPPANGIMKPKRTKPRIVGEFSVGLVLIKFKELSVPDTEIIEKRTFYFKGMHATEYFKTYTQGITWPAPYIMKDQEAQPVVYNAPEPLGYYCEYDFWSNPLGFEDSLEGKERAKKATGRG